MACETIGFGFVDGDHSDWHNRIQGNAYRKPLEASDGVQFIHVGPHRTGATFLQSKVFPLYAESRSIFSDDVICGKFFDNGLANVAKLHAFCPNAKIIIVLRNQLSIINSAYRTYIKAGGGWSFPRYAEEIIKQNKYNYAELLSAYFNFFGQENCLVLFYEDLVKNPEDFIKSLLTFIGSTTLQKHDLGRVKAGPSRFFNAYLRIVNICLKHLCHFLFRSKRNSPSRRIDRIHRIRRFFLRWGVTLDDRIIKKNVSPNHYKIQFGYERTKKNIRSAYRNCNEKLENMLNKNLKSNGY